MKYNNNGHEEVREGGRWSKVEKIICLGGEAGGRVPCSMPLVCRLMYHIN